MYGGMHGFGFWMWENFGWFGVFLGWLLQIGLIIGTVLLAVWLVRRFLIDVPGRNAFDLTSSRASAEEILQTRYAGGEITRDQYFEMLADIRS